MIAVIEYKATANLSEEWLRINKTNDAMKTTGVAPR
jgi:hypothetical protein